MRVRDPARLAPAPDRGVRLPALENQRHERLAQLLALGGTQRAALDQVYPTENIPEDPETHKRWDRNRTKHAQKRAGMVRLRTLEIQAETVVTQQKYVGREAAAQQIKVQVRGDMVLTGVLEIADRCMQAVPVKVQGKEVGVWKFDATGALKAFELLGTEAGLFQKTHKLLHGQIDPLEGTHGELLGRIRIYLDRMSADDLAAIGYQRQLKEVPATIEAEPVTVEVIPDVAS